MKIDLTTLVDKFGVSPNGLYVLICLYKGIVPQIVDVDQEKKQLAKDGFLEKDVPTSKATELIAKLTYLSRTGKAKMQLKKEELSKIELYRLLFPPGKLPSGSHSRSSINELKPRFEWFFTQYPHYYDWDLVLQATALYIDEYEPKGFEYMRNSENFIYKQDLNKIMKSLLADYCQLVIDGTSEPSSAPSIITIPGLNI
jgi:hypothetical protein